jgi:hypothetical protein
LKRRVISAKELPEKKVEKKLRAVDKTKKVKFVMTPTKKE